MTRAYKFRMRPTAGQHVRLAACLESHRELYNAALQERRGAWMLRRIGVSYSEQSAQLKEIRRLRPDVGLWSFSSQQATLRKLDRAFAAFFRRIKAAETPGYPRFKAANRFHSVVWPKDGDGCRWKPEANRIYLKGIGTVKVTAHRAVKGRVKTLEVQRSGRHWYLVISAARVPDSSLEPTGQSVGLDMGIASFATTSDGYRIDNPRWGRQAAHKLSTSQRALARKPKPSTNRRRAVETVAARHRKIANQRRDFHHKVAKALVSQYDLLVVERLKIKNMTRRVERRPDPDQPGSFLANGQTAKSGLNRSISDAGWAAFVSILRAKAEEAGRRVIDVDPRRTSQTCGHCGHSAKANRASQAVFKCEACGFAEHADVNAACNILRVGLAHLAAANSAAA